MQGCSNGMNQLQRTIRFVFCQSTGQDSGYKHVAAAQRTACMLASQSRPGLIMDVSYVSIVVYIYAFAQCFVRVPHNVIRKGSFPEAAVVAKRRVSETISESPLPS